MKNGAWILEKPVFDGERMNDYGALA